MQFAIDVDAIVGVLVVAARGDLTGTAVRRFEACLDGAVAGHRPVIVDLDGTAYLDAGAMRVLSAAQQQFGTRLGVVAHRGGAAWTALQAAGVERDLVLHSSRPAALAVSTALSA